MAKRSDDFTQGTKELLAKRAGYTCSYPNCGLRTIGAGTGSDSATASIGVAAHIHAASPGGPRYDPDQDEKRHAITNGIWLCRTHATLQGSVPTKPVTLVFDAGVSHQEVKETLPSKSWVKA